MYLLIYQWTPLHTAAGQGDLDAANFIANRVADINVKDKNGVSMDVVLTYTRNPIFEFQLASFPVTLHIKGPIFTVCGEIARLQVLCQPRVSSSIYIRVTKSFVNENKCM